LYIIFIFSIEIYFILGKAVDRINGVKILEMTEKVRQNAGNNSVIMPTKKAEPKEKLEDRLKRLINSHEVWKQVNHRIKIW